MPMPSWYTNLTAQWRKGRSRLRPGSPRGPDWHRYSPLVKEIRRRQADFLRHDEASLNRHGRELRRRAPSGERALDTMAFACVAAKRTLGVEPYDAQLVGALVMYDEKIAEMQTGEGKTLAAALTVCANALDGTGVHVWTANDYLARRDAQWMGPVYRMLGLSVGFVTQSLSASDRHAAYACDVTYATPNEIGFDLLRDGVALDPSELTQRAFDLALIDEIDAILIDEARIPLIIAGESSGGEKFASEMARIVARFEQDTHYTTDEYARDVRLSDLAVAEIEVALRCGNLFELRNLARLTAAQNAVHAKALLRRDIDYVVKNGAIESVDEFKGRIAQNRRWPAGLQTALEAKEGLPLTKQGRVLGSITVQYLSSLYRRLCGMTGTAATQWEEFRQLYNLEVVMVPTNRPVVRIDLPDRIFETKAEKEKALVEEILRVHSTGQPILVGTASVAESEHLSATMSRAGVSHQVLNAKNDEAEAAIVARAGHRGQVTISTNMAGRGTDIPLGPAVAELGGLHVIGTNRHQARRIDNQLRGRAGRQGDPGSSQFFVSLEDDLITRYGIRPSLSTYSADRGKAIDHVQRIIEGENLEIRQTLWKYESLIEWQRREIRERRMKILTQTAESLLDQSDPARFAELSGAFGETRLREIERLITLAKIDDAWSDYLVAVSDLRGGIHWVSLSGHQPLHEFLTTATSMFREVTVRIRRDVLQALRHLGISDDIEIDSAFHRGATWTYLVNDQPFENEKPSWANALRRKLKKMKAAKVASEQVQRPT